MTNEKAKKLLTKTPKSPGIYFFWEGPTITYVGKATVLRNRLLSYFSGKERDPRKRTMTERSTRITWKIFSSPIEALVAEASYIKKYHPHYNVTLRDDKHYFYVGFTNQDCPRLFLTHQPYKTGNTTYVGPFTEGRPLKETLKFLRRVFPYCTHRNIPKNCLWYTLGLCPLSSKPTAEEIRTGRENTKALQAILSGKRKGLLIKLRKDMQQASRTEEYERAALIRDRITALQNIFEHAPVLFREEYAPKDKNAVLREIPEGLATHFPKKHVSEWRIEGYDISNIQGHEATGSLVSFLGNKPNKKNYKRFRIKTVEGANDVAMMKEVLGRRLMHQDDWPLPDIFLIDGGRPQVNAANNTVLEWEKLTGETKKAPLIIGLAKRNEELYLTMEKKPYQLSKSHQILLMFMRVRDEAHRFAKAYHSKLHTKAALRE